MTATDFPEANATFGPPPDMTESQVAPIRAFHGVVEGGTCDGARIVVVAWRLEEHDIRAINEGAPIYLSMIGGLSPHILGTNFNLVRNPA